MLHTRPKSVLYKCLSLCQALNIRINNFYNLRSFKSFIEFIWYLFQIILRCTSICKCYILFHYIYNFGHNIILLIHFYLYKVIFICINVINKDYYPSASSAYMSSCNMHNQLCNKMYHLLIVAMKLLLLWN